MNKTQIALVAGAIVLTFLLYQLPRSVVENDPLVSLGSADHTFTMPENVMQQVAQFRSSWEREENVEKKLNFADSLATMYLDYQVLDSGIWFVDYIQTTNSSGRELRIADLLYRAFQRTSNAEEARELGERARRELKSLLAQYSENSSLKNRLAMTLVATETPMQGIEMLREILEDKPRDTETIKNLGVLSIQSGQFARAEDRFKSLLEIDSSDLEAQFYLGMSQIEQGDDEGMKIMEKLSQNNVNPAIKSLAQDYLEN